MVTPSIVAVESVNVPVTTWRLLSPLNEKLGPSLPSKSALRIVVYRIMSRSLPPPAPFPA
jgi:hypothetical protein